MLRTMTLKVSEDGKGKPYFIQCVTGIEIEHGARDVFVVHTIFDDQRIPIYDEENPGDGTVIEVSA